MVEEPAKFEVIKKYQMVLLSPAQNENPCYVMGFEVEEEIKNKNKKINKNNSCLVPETAYNYA